MKCQDEVSACMQRLTHVELVLNFWVLGYYPKDLFVLHPPEPTWCYHAQRSSCMPGRTTPTSWHLKQALPEAG